MRLVCLALILIAAEDALVSGVPVSAMAQTMVTASDARARLWAGSYVYEDALGEIPARSGTHVFITYKLRVPKSASRPATLNADGFQTEDRVRCAISGSEDRIEIRFISFADGTVANQFGVAVYQPNDVLFTLERVRTNGVQVVVTEWRALKPSGVAHRRGRYFMPVLRLGTHARKGS